MVAILTSIVLMVVGIPGFTQKIKTSQSGKTSHPCGTIIPKAPRFFSSLLTRIHSIRFWDAYVKMWHHEIPKNCQQFTTISTNCRGPRFAEETVGKKFQTYFYHMTINDDLRVWFSKVGKGSRDHRPKIKTQHLQKIWFFVTSPFLKGHYITNPNNAQL